MVPDRTVGETLPKGVGHAPGLLVAQLLMPALAVVALALLVAHHLHHAIALPATLVIGCGTLVAYCLDRLWDHRDDPWLWSLRWRSLGPILVPVLGISALGLVLALGFAPYSVLWSAVALGLMSIGYPFAKALPGAKTMLVASAWTLATGVIADAHPASSWPSCVEVFLIVAGSAILCDLKDARRDRATGVRSLVVLCGPVGAILIASAVCVAAAGLALRDHAPWLAITAGAQVLAAPWRSLLELPVRGPLLLDGLLAACPLAGLLVERIT